MAALPTHGAFAQKPLSESITASSVNKARAACTSLRARASNSCCWTVTGSACARAPPAAAARISSAAKHLTAKDLSMACLLITIEKTFDHRDNNGWRRQWMATNNAAPSGLTAQRWWILSPPVRIVGSTDIVSLYAIAHNVRKLNNS